MKKHVLYYVSLLAILLVGMVFVKEFAQQKQIQMVVVVVLGIVYVFWGLLHHKLHHSLRAKIVLEYVAVASLGIALILFIIKSLL